MLILNNRNPCRYRHNIIFFWTFLWLLNRYSLTWTFTIIIFSFYTQISFTSPHTTSSLFLSEYFILFFFFSFYIISISHPRTRYDRKYNRFCVVCCMRLKFQLNLLICLTANVTTLIKEMLLFLISFFFDLLRRIIPSWPKSICLYPESDSVL